MASVKFDVSDVTNRLKSAKLKLSDMTSFFKAIADLELSQTKLRYRQEVDPSGKAWPDPITIRRDAGPRNAGFTREQTWNYVLKSNFHAAPPGWHFFSKARGDKKLRDTGVLYNSLGVAFGKDYAIVGTNVEYSTKLQDGRFPFLGLNAKSNKNINKALDMFLKGLFK